MIPNGIHCRDEINKCGCSRNITSREFIAHRTIFSP